MPPLVVVTGAAQFEGAFIALEAVRRNLPVLAVSVSDLGSWNPDVIRHPEITVSGRDICHSSSPGFIVNQASQLYRPDTSIYVIACPDRAGMEQHLGVTPLFREFQRRFGERVHCAVVHAEQNAQEEMWPPEFQVPVPHVEARLKNTKKFLGDRLEASSLAQIFLLGFLGENFPLRSGAEQVYGPRDVEHHWEFLKREG